MTTFDALIPSTPGKSAPDAHDFDFGRPSDDFVVSRDIQGWPLSRYADLIWDRTPYSTGNARRLAFSFWETGAITPRRAALAKELQWFMFLMIWRHPMRRALKTSSLLRVLSAGRMMAKLADSKEITFKQLLADPKFVSEIVMANSQETLGLITLLQHLGPELTGYEIANEAIKPLKNAAVAYRSSLKQTAPLPTHVYSIFLSNLEAEVEKIDKHIDRMISLYKEIILDPSVGRNAKMQAKFGKCEIISFDALLIKHGVADFYATRGVVLSSQGLYGFFKNLQVLLLLQIQAYTGMRANEAQYLPYECLEESRRDSADRIHYIIKGQVTKLTSGNEMRTQWVTIEAAAKAVRIAQKIASAAYAAHTITPNKINSRKNGSFLFPTVYFRNPSDKIGTKNSVIDQPITNIEITPWIQNLLCAVIENADQEELYSIDPHRQWATEAAFAVGARWHLHSHQLRRSLALYAQASGLVSLPSLKRQLKHITQEMTLYYSKGSAFANNFIGDPCSATETHIGEEWRDTQPVSQYLAYAASILLSNKDEIFGGHAQWLNIHRRDKNGRVLINRDETLKRFKRGEMAYRSTPLGGCTNPGPCDRNPIKVLSLECLIGDCKNLIASKEKVQKLIFVKTKGLILLKETDPLAAEIRIEEAEINLMKKALVRGSKTSDAN